MYPDESISQQKMDELRAGLGDLVLDVEIEVNRLHQKQPLVIFV
jgi:hypothetical protein